MSLRWCCVLISFAMGLQAQEPALRSPDGRFIFEAFAPTESEPGHPPFGIVETATKKVIWSAPEELGDVSRPEETILWSPDSQRFALTTRISTRRMATFFFGWKNGTFVPLPWKQASRLETLADEVIAGKKTEAGFGAEAGNGRVLQDDITADRWVDGQTVVVRRVMEVSFEEGEKQEVLTASISALLRWKGGAFVIQKTSVDKVP